MSIVDLLREKVHASVERLIQLACIISLFCLFLCGASLLYPKPLPVVLSMTVGHLLGIIALGLYLIAIVFDTIGPRRPMDPVPTRQGDGGDASTSSL